MNYIEKIKTNDVSDEMSRRKLTIFQDESLLQIFKHRKVKKILSLAKLA